MATKAANITMEESSIPNAARRNDLIGLPPLRTKPVRDDCEGQGGSGSSCRRARDSSQIEKVPPSLIHWRCGRFLKKVESQLQIQNRSLRGDAARV
jgi:hypothetical protein